MRKLLENKILLKFLFWVWFIIIFILSSLPNIPTQKINIWDEPWRLDYLEHFLVFGLLAGLFVIWKFEKDTFFIKKYFASFILLIIFAAATEIHQIWIPGRSFNPLDLIYNLVGLISFFIISPYIVKRIYKK